MTTERDGVRRHVVQTKASYVDCRIWVEAQVSYDKTTISNFELLRLASILRRFRRGDVVEIDIQNAAPIKHMAGSDENSFAHMKARSDSSISFLILCVDKSDTSRVHGKISIEPNIETCLGWMSLQNLAFEFFCCDLGKNDPHSLREPLILPAIQP